MLISNVHKSIIVMNSLDTRFSKNVFEAVQKTRSTCFIASKTTRLRLVVLNPIKHSCSFFKHYKNCIKLDFYLPHHLQIYHTTSLTLSKACIIHCLTYKDWASCAFPSDMCTPLAKILDPPLIVKKKHYIFLNIIVDTWKASVFWF